jgi:methylphosphotriester-DNA--protein-cysteine methyltransferase
MSKTKWLPVELPSLAWPLPLRDGAPDSPIKRAKNLLLNRYYSIGEIAQELGFHSSIHFTRAFERTVGELPVVYRGRLPVVDAAAE